MLSLRLTRQEFAEVAVISDAEQGSLSDVVRDAIRQYVQQRGTVSLVAPTRDLNFVMPSIVNQTLGAQGVPGLAEEIGTTSRSRDLIPA
jgi:hypothetical protein